MLRWLGFHRQFEHVPDTFTQRRAKIVNAIVDVAHKETKKGRQVLLLSHFPEAFAEIAQALEDRAVQYVTLDGNEPVIQVHKTATSQIPLPAIGWTGSFFELPLDEIDQLDAPLSIVVIERHPRPEYDRVLVKNFRRISNDVRIGWYLSFEDPVVQTCIGHNGIELMKLLGMKQDDVVTSEMLGNRITRMLRSKTMKCDPSIEFESARQWVECLAK